jgi:hypothetical protein
MLDRTLGYCALAAAVALAAACATPDEIRYTAAYHGISSSSVVRLAREATANEGYVIATEQNFKYSYSFITAPELLEPHDSVQVGFMVQIVYENAARTKDEFSIIVTPRAFAGRQEVDAKQLPPTARTRAAALSSAIRAHSQQYEAPI